MLFRSVLALSAAFFSFAGAWGQSCDCLSTLDVVKAQGVLRAGVKNDYPPFGYVDQGGNIVGFDVDIARYFAQKLGVKIELVPVTSKARVPMLLNRSVDLIAATMAHLIERDQVVDFSIDYYLPIGWGFLVLKDAGLGKTKEELAPRLANKPVALVQGTPFGELLSRFQPKAVGITFQQFPEGVLAVKTRKAVALYGEVDNFVMFLKDDPNLEVIATAESLTGNGIAVRHNDSKWRNWINHALIEMWESGAYHAIHRKWIGQDPNPNFRMPAWKMLAQ